MVRVDNHAFRFNINTCQEELRNRLQHVQDLMRELQAGTDEVRAVVTDTKYVMIFVNSGESFKEIIERLTKPTSLPESQKR